MRRVPEALNCSHPRASQKKQPKEEKKESQENTPLHSPLRDHSCAQSYMGVATARASRHALSALFSFQRRIFAASFVDHSKGYVLQSIRDLVREMAGTNRTAVTSALVFFLPLV